MTFNPSPKVAAARHFADSFKKQVVIIVANDDNSRIGYANYGAKKGLCEEARNILSSRGKVTSHCPN